MSVRGESLYATCICFSVVVCGSLWVTIICRTSECFTCLAVAGVELHCTCVAWHHFTLPCGWASYLGHRGSYRFGLLNTAFLKDLNYSDYVKKHMWPRIKHKSFSWPLLYRPLRMTSTTLVQRWSKRTSCFTKFWAKQNMYNRFKMSNTYSI